MLASRYGVLFCYMLVILVVDGSKVPDLDDKPPAKRTNGGMRLLVLWLCWVLLAVFLTAAGVIGFV